jgi:DNA-binding transcriptional regulator YiaG
MDRKVQNIAPDYRRIYSDIISIKYPERFQDCKILLEKPMLTVLDIIKLDRKIFGSGDESTQVFNQKHKSYSKSDILKILDFQKKENLNNSQTAKYFNISRNSLSKWKKIFEL